MIIIFDQLTITTTGFYIKIVKKPLIPIK